MASLEHPLVAAEHTSGTHDRILDVSERLFAELGITGTSVRAITDQAHVNVAAVNYHFGSKENLVRAVVTRRFESLEAARSMALNEVEARCQREARAPRTDEIAEALIGPVFLQSQSDDSGWSNFIRLLSRLAWEPGAEKFTPPESSLRIFERFDEALQKAVPTIADQAGRRCWRIAFMRAATQQTLLMIDNLRSGNTPNAIAFAGALNSLNTDAIKRELIAFVAAGLASK